MVNGDGISDAILENPGTQPASYTFLRLALNGDLATAWPFAVEGEAFAHRFFSLISLI